MAGKPMRRGDGGDGGGNFIDFAGDGEERLSLEMAGWRGFSGR